MQSFEYNANPARVLFGSGTLQKLPDEIKRLNISKPLLLTNPRQREQAEDVKRLLSGDVSDVHNFTGAVMHTPVNVTNEALTYAKDLGVDGIISMGGGSVVGLGKAIAVRTGLPHICIPTTYSGSEMTPVLGETQDGRKTTRKDPKILPRTVLYDVDLTMTLPASTSATSGVNAIAHSVEALYAPNTNPVINMLAIEGIKALATALPDIVSDPSSHSARSSALYGAWLCGMCLGEVGMGLHHKLCHVLGGSFGLPHAETHTIILAHAVAYNAPAIPQVMKDLAKVIPDSGGDAIRGLNLLLGKLKVKRGLKDLGMRKLDIDTAADIAFNSPYPNPRPFDKKLLREIMRRAWLGEVARDDI